MGYSRGCYWDEKKNELVIACYGVSLGEFVDIVRSEIAPVWGHPGYPDQLRTADLIRGELYTVVFEEIDDGYGKFIKIITAWPATAAERKRYEQN